MTGEVMGEKEGEGGERRRGEKRRGERKESANTDLSSWNDLLIMNNI